MSNRGKFILILLAIIVIAGIIALELTTEKSETIKECRAVYDRHFFCVVEKKEKIAKDHGTIKIYCRDIETDTTFVFYPLDVYESQKFFSKAIIGDTLKKQASNNCFLIINGSKRDSVVFNCEY